MASRQRAGGISPTVEEARHYLITTPKGMLRTMRLTVRTPACSSGLR